jgi:uncharacterized membrane protein YoaT (DUF817 family)
MAALKQLLRFDWEQAQSCLFPVVIFASLAITKIIPLPFLPRYDWLLIISLLMQWWLVPSIFITIKIHQGVIQIDK